MATEGSVYFERQSLQLCALHALNNLFQRQAFTKSQLDQIAQELSPDNWINPHKSVCGWGNYDVNVLLAALTQHNLTGIWFDRRRDPAKIVLDKVVGFILNIPSQSRIGPIAVPFLHRPHWITVRKLGTEYYEFDSKSADPLLIGCDEHFVEYLRCIFLTDAHKQLFVVVKCDVAEDRSWLAE